MISTKLKKAIQGKNTIAELDLCDLSAMEKAQLVTENPQLLADALGIICRQLGSDAADLANVDSDKLASALDFAALLEEQLRHDQVDIEIPSNDWPGTPLVLAKAINFLRQTIAKIAEEGYESHLREHPYNIVKALELGGVLEDFLDSIPDESGPQEG